jgi:hypothetical protein
LRYDLVIVGYRLNASVKPAQALQTVLGLDSETARGLTRQFPATVLTGLSLTRAESVAKQLTDLGAKVDVIESRLSHASEPEKRTHSGRPVPADEQSGNYAIGEILAPMGRHQSLPSDAAGSAQPKRPSREELDAALRDSFRPQTTPISLPPAPLSAEHDAAFAGIQNFGDNLDGFNDGSTALEVDEVALRSIQRRVEASPTKPKRRSVWQALEGLLSNLATASMEWALGLFWLLVIGALTLVAVGYALDERDLPGALRREAEPALRMIK